MSMYKEKKKNLIFLVIFAVIFSTLSGGSLWLADRGEESAAVELSTESVIVNVSQNAEAAPNDVNDSQELAADEAYEEGADVSTEGYTVTEYETDVTMYAKETVNVRAGAGTDYDKVGKLHWGNTVSVTGETDNGWYEVSYNDSTAYIMGEYMTSELPSIPYLFVGDSRTVQMQSAVGCNDKAYIAKIGEGYSFFKNTVIPEIPQYAGNGTKLVINFGVNDLGNVKKYIQLVNSNIDAWTEAGITVYYSAVTPVGEGTTVSNAQIESFNAQLKEGLDPRVIWIDSYTYLSQTGFSTADGLHYNSATYRNLYSYYMAVFNEENNQV
ncbi:SH3 domain-containing protein [Butyrivibrio proteoclasticus]|uniref:SH3 domain-containing protein n=1 Tax=Butyrivibrio proteoclasticus TaxID=43305 RepID=UPI00047D758E|nr:SH3 domain-containing protein [Butyrivibrio proteoclasticus]